MRTDHLLLSLLARGLAGVLGRMPPGASLSLGERLGDLARALGVRRAVAEENLALAFPDRAPEERRAILVAHYRELGRVLCEYPRLGELARSPVGGVVAEARGLEHLDAARAAGRGAILMTGHYGNFELLGAWLGQRHPVDFVVKPVGNPGVDEALAGWRAQAGVGVIPVGAGVRRVFQALRANRWVAMLADQDVAHYGTFVPFFGRPASTALGPARIALRAGAPIIMGFANRWPDGRHSLEVLPPLPVPTGADAWRGDEEAVRALTALHTATLEEWVRKRPEMWLWLHRRWKTPPPGPSDAPAAARRT